MSNLVAEILGAVLPVEKIDDIPSGFTTTGHIGTLCFSRAW